MVIDFHFHAGLYHELHPWVIEWIKTEIEDPEAFVNSVLTPERIVRYLRENGVDYAVALLMVHSGRGFWYDRAYFLAKLHANVYMEIAGLPPQKLLDYFPELERVSDKVIFGSDWPGMPHIGRNIEIIRGLPLKEETKEKILGGNAARILGIVASSQTSDY